MHDTLLHEVLVVHQLLAYSCLVSRMLVELLSELRSSHDCVVARRHVEGALYLLLKENHRPVSQLYNSVKEIIIIQMESDNV